MLSNNNKVKIKLATKWIIVVLFIIILTAIETTGKFNNAKPLLVIPVLVSIAMYHNELISGIVGAFCGLMIDYMCGKLMGVNAMLMLVIAVLISLLCMHLLRSNILNAIWLSAVVAGIQGFFDFFFNYAIWNMDNYFTVAKEIIIPSIIYTILSSPIIYLVITYIISKFEIKDKIDVNKNAAE